MSREGVRRFDWVGLYVHREMMGAGCFYENNDNIKIKISISISAGWEGGYLFGFKIMVLVTTLSYPY